MVKLIETSFQKDFTSEYMIIMADSGEINESHYEIQMLQNNCIYGLLLFQVRNMNEHLQYFYNIKGFISMTDLLEREKYIGTDIAGLMMELHRCMEALDSYLLEKSALNLDEHFIYYHMQSKTFAFTYIPGYYQPVEEQIKNLLSWMMKHIDYKRKSDVNLVYDIYRKIENNEPYVDLFVEDNEKENDSSNNLAVNSGRLNNQLLHMDDMNLAHLKNEDNGCIQNQFQTYMQWCRKICLITGGAGIVSFVFRKSLCIWIRQQTGIIFNDILIPMLFLILCIVSGSLIAVLHYVMQNNALSNNVTQKEDKMQNSDIKMQNSDIRVQNSDIRMKNTLNKGRDKKDFWDEKPVIDYASIRENQTSVLQSSELQQRKDSDGFLETVLLERQTILQLIPEQDKDVICVLSFPFTIGKNEKVVQYCIDSDVVSRRHVQLTQEEQKYFITDLHSTNGTWINDKRLIPNRAYELHHSDIIKIADMCYEVQIKQAVSREDEL